MQNYVLREENIVLRDKFYKALKVTKKTKI